MGQVVPRPGDRKYVPLKSGTDPAKDFMNGKTAILYNGSWTAVDTRKKFKDVVFLPSVDLGQGPKIGGGSWQWGASTNCATPEGAADYLKFAAQDKYVASVAKATTNIPATDAAALRCRDSVPVRRTRSSWSTPRSSPCYAR